MRWNWQMQQSVETRQCLVSTSVVLSSMNSYLGTMKRFSTYRLRKKMFPEGQSSGRFWANFSAFFWNEFFISGRYCKIVRRKKLNLTKNSWYRLFGSTFFFWLISSFSYNPTHTRVVSYIVTCPYVFYKRIHERIWPHCMANFGRNKKILHHRSLDDYHFDSISLYRRYGFFRGSFRCQETARSSNLRNDHYVYSGSDWGSEIG